MNESLIDFELLRDFIQNGDQGAFTAVVRRHLDLVYGTAMRKVEDHSAAEEIAQNVFATLSRKAWQFARDDSLPAWLHRTTLLEAKTWLRGELRRRRREQSAAELGTTMNTSQEEPTLRALTPLLDGGLLSLREKDRAALLLRYYEGRSLREVAEGLGVGEQAAHKRIATALEKLADFFQKRGFRTATSALAAATLQQSASSAPALAAASILTAVGQVVPPPIFGLAGGLARIAGLTKAQSAAICLIVVAIPVAWQLSRAHIAVNKAARAQSEFTAIQARQEQLSEEIQREHRESMRLDGAISTALVMRARNAQALDRWNMLATRIRGLLTDPNYHWQDDVPYVRIPKSLIKHLLLQDKFMPSGKMSEAAVEVLAMTPEERISTERTLADYWKGLSSLVAAHAYETNAAPSWSRDPNPVSLPPGTLTRTVVVPPLGAELKQLAQNTGLDLADRLQEERKNLLFGGWESGAMRVPNFGMTNFWTISEQPQSFTVWINPRASAGRDADYYGASWKIESGLGMKTAGEGALNNMIPGSIYTRFFQTWLQQFGITNNYPSVVP